MPRNTSLTLRFVSGPLQGGEYPLRPDREITIGRQASLDIVFAEDMVSRKHTRIATTGGEVTIEDLGSTNGTFVNGQKIKRKRLKEGDRVLVGISLLRVVAASGEPPSDEEVRKDLSRRESRAQSAGRMAGSLAEFPLPDLLQLLGTGRKTGALRVDGPGGPGVGGAIHVKAGAIVDATLDDLAECPARKALFRMLVWDGTFELGPADPEAREALDESTEALLLDGLREVDELARIAPRLPGEDERLAIAAPLEASLRDLAPDELDVLQAVHNLSDVGAIIDRISTTDYEAWKSLVSLVEQGYVVRRK